MQRVFSHGLPLNPLPSPLHFNPTLIHAEELSPVPVHPHDPGLVPVIPTCSEYSVMALRKGDFPLDPGLLPIHPHMQRVLSHGLPLTPPPSTPPALGHCHPAGEISPCLPASCRFILTCSEYSVMVFHSLPLPPLHPHWATVTLQARFPPASQPPVASS
ncbi:unnamed protein product [Closterium sp. Naga37s-1]|nr:unnamed protein product [Closterium sp. Naga37s-1]